MELKASVLNPGFDINMAFSVAQDYFNSTGNECAIIDNEGKYLYNSNRNCGLCKYCKNLHNGNPRVDCGSQIHLYGSYQAERFGGKYVYFCPIGLVYWASPIIVDSMLKGALIGGPVLLVEHEEFIIDEILKKNSISSHEMEELRSLLASIPFISPEKVTSHSEMLFIISTYLSNRNAAEYRHEQEMLDQQSNISEYIKYIKTMGGDDSSISEYPLQKEKELLSFISLGDKAGAQKLLNEILGHVFFSSSGKLDIVKARVLELVVLLSRAALEGGADVEQIFGLNFNYLKQVQNFQTIEDLSFWLSKIMLRFTDCVFNFKDIKHVDVIFKAVGYIKRNYMKKITLKEVADHVYLSSSYFSKLFKEEMKFNFNTFLNQVRIDKSKTLLRDNSIPLVDVAFLMGFEDQSYFSKVFKKLEGVSPGRFREARGYKSNIGKSI
jgi:two-component system, response regulator YesN